MRLFERPHTRRSSSSLRSPRQQVALAGLVALVVLGLAGLSVSACTAETPPPGEAPRQGQPLKTTHAIHVFAKTSDGRTVPLNFGPGTEATFSPEAIPTTFPTGLPTGTGVVDAAPLQSPATIESPGVDPWSTAWPLVWRAAGQCGIWTFGGHQIPVPPWNGWFDGFGAWYVYGQGITDCADRLQVEQNLVCVADKLAEIADAVGTTVWPAAFGVPGATTVDLGNVDGGSLESLAFAEWDIPPQADADRFIVRDLAIHTIAMIPPIDAYTDIAFPEPLPPRSTCSQAFAWFANPGNTGAGCISSAFSQPLFGVSNVSGFTPSFPPSATAVCDSSGRNNVAPIAQSALDIDAQILRSGGRLLHDLIRRDVYSDMAAAAQQSAQTLDPVAGNENAWGAGSNGPYGSIAHAARVLLGRWEIGDSKDFGNVADPQCEGTTEIALVPGAFGNDLSARVLDRPIRTPGEQTAVQLVERSGIVIPTCVLPGGLDFPDGGTGGSDGGGPSAAGLRQALVDQLVLEEQISNGLSSPPPEAALMQVVAPLSDDEIAFAFMRATRTWRLMTNSADTSAQGSQPDGGAGPCVAVASDPLPAGLQMLTDKNGNDAIAPGVAALKGIVVKGGLARARLGTDPMARAAGMQEASECNDRTTWWDEWGRDGTATLNDSADVNGNNMAIPPTAALPVGVFQDSFHVGQGLERRLNVLQQAAAGLAFTDPANVARGGIGELRSWAGTTIVHAWPQGSVPAHGGAPRVASSFVVRVGGMSVANDFGIASGAPLTPIQDALVFVYGPPWVAECAAGVRPDCPANFATYEQKGVVADLRSQYAPGGANASAGVVDDVFQLTVQLPMPTPLPGSGQPVVDPTQPGESHLYMVRLHDPTDPQGHGHVMGTIALRGRWICNSFVCSLSGEPSGFVDAPMQRELVHDAIDLGKWVGAKPPALGDPSAAQTSGYCVDGVPRDLFVPLDNELISSSQTYEDSWQHYLDLAQQAAQAADALGQQLIADDLQIAENQQAAEEQLANICGDFGALSTATVGNDGTISAGPEDPTTQSCINEPITDVVFLGNLPANIPTTGDQTCQIKIALNCASADLPQGCSGTGSQTPAASAVQLCKKPILTADALMIPNAVKSPPAQTPGALSSACQSIASNVAPTLRTGLAATPFLQALDDSNLDPTNLQFIASQLKMVVGLDGNWSVQFFNQTIMQSDDSRYWPGCLGGSGCSSGSAVAVTKTMADSWSRVFRSCTNPSDDVATVGLGCEGVLTTGQDPVQAETSMLRWRVMQALWTIAASGGVLPKDMFTLPIPASVSDDNGTCQSWPMCTNINPGGGFNFPYFYGGTASYYVGSLKQVGGSPCGTLATNCYLLDTGDSNVSTGDELAAGPLYDVSPGFKAFGARAYGEIPAWYLFLYNSKEPPTFPVVHAITTSGPTVFNQSPPCHDGDNGCTAPAAQAVQTPLAQIFGQGVGVDGASCRYNYGEPPSGGAGSWWNAVGAFKGGILSPTDCGSNSMAYGWDKTFASSQNWDPSQPFTPPFGPPQFTYTPNAFVSGNWHASCLPPSSRAVFFTGSNASPDGTCGAAALLLQTSLLACGAQLVGMGPGGLDPTQPPQVNSIQDIPVLQAWLASASSLLASSVGAFYAQEIPARVVSDFKMNTVGSGNLGGQKGQAILSLEQSLQQFPQGWLQVSSDLQQIEAAVRLANGMITGAGLQEDTQLGQLALQQIQVQASMSAAVTQFMETVVSAAAQSAVSFGASNAVDPIAAVALANALAYGNQELNQLQSLANTAQKVDQNEVNQALIQLAQTTGPLWADIQKQVDSLRATLAAIDAGGQTIQQDQNEAAYQAAIGTGQDFVTIAGQTVPLPVNTVLRRQASATEQRYQTALKNAKGLAYMARRAIEQRIGVPLDALTQQIGPLDPPASWADDVCSLQGVNYAALSTAVPTTNAEGGAVDGGGIGGSADLQAINQFADAWIGDYVTKLQNFVTYFNVQYPNHQGDDTAILSLRYDLLEPTSQCMAQGPNLLLNSGDLSTMSAPGWGLGACDETGNKCLATIGDYALPGTPSGPGDVGGPGNAGTATLQGSAATGVTWLLDVGGSSSIPDGGTGGDAGATSSALPAGFVGQSVQLSAGSYVLSWWDQARNAADGSIQYASGTTPPAYVVEVLDPNGGAIAINDQPPYAPPTVGDAGAPSLWSPRRVLSFTVPTTGVYTVALAAAEPGSTSLGSVAIADVQLEEAASGQPTEYVATTSSTTVPALNCTLSDSDLRAAFTHNCDANGVCSYDLNLPLIIDTTALGGGAALGSKLANGNFNYRHITSAINLVGTNVHSCTNNPNPNCYGSAYIQYDLQHDATSAGIIGYDGNARLFDFGIGAINHGKALAAERYLTLPLSSNDQALISQPGIMHVEMGGRPLDGTYHLRIWDAPDLNWSALQDVQILLDYEYWSQIQANGNVQMMHRLKRAPRRPIYLHKLAANRATH